MNSDVLNRLVVAARDAFDALRDKPYDERIKVRLRLGEALADVARDASFQKRRISEFDGETYDPSKDKARLKHQLGRVYETMIDGLWRTLEGVAKLTGASEAAVSARLRDLRKPKFGGYVVERRAREPRKSGLFEYRLLSADGKVIRQLDGAKMVELL